MARNYKRDRKGRFARTAGGGKKGKSRVNKRKLAKGAIVLAAVGAGSFAAAKYAKSGGSASALRDLSNNARYQAGSKLNKRNQSYVRRRPTRAETTGINNARHSFFGDVPKGVTKQLTRTPAKTIRRRAQGNYDRAMDRRIYGTTQGR